MASGRDFQVVGFKIGAESFAVPIALVREIVRVPEITAVPQAADSVEGVINLRGKIIPVVDLRRCFGEPRTARSKKNRVLVAEVEGKVVGMLVDSASEVLKLSPSDVEPPPQVLESESVNYVTGIGKLGGRLIILVDLGKVLRGDETKRFPQTQAQAATA